MAFREAVEAFPDARLTMIGDGILLEACQQLARALRIEQTVAFLGARPHREVAAAMQQARAFVQHSMRCSNGDSEGTSLGILEAGAAGLPVVTTRHAGIQEVVIHGETGFLVDEGDVDTMAQQMITLARDPSLAATMGRRAREYACAHFSMEKSIGTLWRILEDAITARPR